MNHDRIIMSFASNISSQVIFSAPLSIQGLAPCTAVSSDPQSSVKPAKPMRLSSTPKVEGTVEIGKTQQLGGRDEKVIMSLMEEILHCTSLDR